MVREALLVWGARSLLDYFQALVDEPMNKTCEVCNRLLNEGDMVVFVGNARYHHIPSRIAFALDEISQPRQLQHFACAQEEA